MRKDFRRVLACVVAVATLGTVTAIPTSAIILNDNPNSDVSTLEYYAENAITEAVIVLENAGDDDGTYYWKSYGVESSIDLSTLTDEDLTTLNKGFPVKIDDSVDVSAVETVLNVNNTEGDDNYIPIDTGWDCYTNMYYDYYQGAWLIEASTIQKETTTIGDSDDEPTNTPTETTLQRGDINGDGAINALDLLQLKKYILGVITSLD